MNCPDCGHNETFHRANTIDQTHTVGDPVPCFAAVAMRQRPLIDGGGWTYDYCECPMVLPR